VRELENLVERLVVLHGDNEVRRADLPEPYRSGGAQQPAAPGKPPSINGPPQPPSAAPAGVASSNAQVLPPHGVDLPAVLAELEERLIQEALERTGGNKNQAAKFLGLNRTTLVEKLRKRARAAAALAAPAGLGAGEEEPPPSA
jgi:sigma-54 specific flagellar transcriptional regulator A